MSETTGEHAGSGPLPAVGSADEARRRAFERSPLPTLLIDVVGGRVLVANAAAGRLFDRRASALGGADVASLYPECRGELHVFTEEALEAGHAWTRDLRPVGEAASKRLEHLGVRVRRGDTWYLHLTVQDIDAFERRTASDDANTYHRRGLSEWRRAERYFREIERDNQLILAAAGEGTYGVNADGVTTFLNPAAETMLGYRAAELVGQQLHAIIHHHRADGSPYPDADCPIYAAFRQGEVKTVDDEVFWRRDGSALRVEYTSTPIVDAGAVVGAVVVFRDITGRKRAEEPRIPAWARWSRISSCG